jgi:NAD(P)-dependent dehydrogenase (short-subunit alcohol dehydrogenase family)
MEFMRRLLVENLGGPFHLLASKDQSFSLNEVPNLHGKVGLVTGGTEGVCFGCTYTLLSHNISKLFVLSISKEKAEDALDMIEERLGSKARQAVEWKQCDLSDWEQTVRAAKEVSKKTDRLDIVINNAARGVMTRQLSASNGIDLHMATNHIGHVVLVSHLLPLLKKTSETGSKVRIVNLVSNLHAAAPSDVAFASIEEIQKDYGPTVQYARSKLAELMYAKYLARNLTSQYPNILVNSSYPGIVDTAQTNDHIREAYPILGYGMAVGLKPFRKNQFDGCVSTMYAATVCEGSGLYSAYLLRSVRKLLLTY